MNHQKKVSILIAITVLIFIVLSSCNLPLFNPPVSSSFDQAHLMMITSRSLLDLYVPLEVTASEAYTSPTMASLFFDPRLLSTLEELNQQKALALEYQRLAGAATKNGNTALAGIWTQKAQTHFAAAEGLEAKRAEWRRSHRLFPAIGRGFRNFGRAIGQVLDFAMRNLADNIKTRFDAYVNEIRAFLRNPIRYTFDLALNRQLEIIKNQFMDRLGPFFGERAYNLIRLDQRAWKLEGRLFNTRTPRTTKTPKTPPPIKQVETPVSPTETQGKIPPNVVGAWHGEACDEAEGTYAYRWSLDLMKEPATSQVVGTLKFHDCPGGGRGLFRVVGTEQTGSTITLSGTLKDGGGELYQTLQDQVSTSNGTSGTMSFTFDSTTGEIEPNFAP
jgi:hypothetical protein